MRALVLSGGIRHDFADNAAALAEQFAVAGFDPEIETNIEAGLARLENGGYALLTVMALRWRMEGDPKYAPHRAEWAFSLSPEGRARLGGFVRSGGGLFGFHTACLCFDDWPEWRDILGGVWVWGRSWHPPLGPVSVARTAEDHPLTAGAGGFELVDEVYSGLSLAAGVRPLLEARAGEMERAEPVLWTHRYGKGRVVFDALGHNRASIENENHAEIVRRAAVWAAGGRSGNDDVRSLRGSGWNGDLEEMRGSSDTVGRSPYRKY
ncbi:MAG: ThuA domain-containing protein [Rhodospirillaceae bacterium]|nr:ThuA domain-containing protein [Rhodospirillaceae bacterium]